MPPAPAVVPGARDAHPGAERDPRRIAEPGRVGCPDRSPSASPSPAPSGSPGPVAGGWTFVKQEKCPESRFECVTLSGPERPHDRGQRPVGRHVRDPAGHGQAARDVRRHRRRAGRQRHLGRRLVHGRGSRAHRRALRLRVPGPARHRPLAPHRLPGRDGRLLHEPVRPGEAGRGRGCRRRRQGLRRRLYRRGEDPRIRAPAVRHDAGDRGPRGHPRLPGRRQARPLRRELRHPVRPDVRGGVSPAHPHAVSRRAGRPHARRADLPRGGRPRLRRRARRDPRPSVPPGPSAWPTSRASRPSPPTTRSPRSCRRARSSTSSRWATGRPSSGRSPEPTSRTP